jgi:hypothetical protein
MVCVVESDNARQRNARSRGDQLAFLSNHQLRERWLQRAQIDANTDEKPELNP